MLTEPSFAPPPEGSYSLCIVAPCFNEAAGIRQFYDQLRQILRQLPDCHPRIVLVDDGSSDATPQVLAEIAREDASVSVLTLSRNFGHQIALTAGLDAADGDAVIMMDSDLQHPPSLIPEMVARWRQGADIVSAIRQSTQGVSFWKRMSSGLFYRLINLLSETHVVPGAADFCLLSRRAHQALLTVRERQRFLRGIVSWIGFNRTFVPFEAPPRFAGKSSYSLGKMIRLAMAAVVSFSSAPLRMATRLGLFVSAAGFAYLLYILLAWLFFERIEPGWTSTISVILILGGVQLVFMGLLGEYLAVVYEEAKQRPLYLLKRPADVNSTGDEENQPARNDA
ncbi:MAG TPA: glycosyltransferase family 2 protein [Pirellulaceae bacterium]|nr:glycosyltransferase family 2 protein [Pirellulaceae bacterium]